ncbi:MAG: TetR/AcrR family transcriptional regulator [Anaerolineales bacterium]|nr:TetR/AcrR family transcriptional regulator [Anaerolineales bacterium]
MTQTRRERIRTETIDEIKSTAWKQVAEQGAASLSLRAIAREMGMTAPGLYRYYKDRDALVTALLMDAFISFGDALESARNEYDKNDHVGSFRAISKAYFQWAADNPQKYLFLFGTPVPGYQFAPELGESAQRSFLALQGVIGEAYKAGKITGELATLRLPTSLKSQYDALKKMGLPYVPLVTHLALYAWSMMHGMTSLFIYGYLTGFLGDQVETFIDVEIEKTIRVLGLE